MRLSRRRFLLACAIVSIVLMPWTLGWLGVPLALGLGVALGLSTAVIATLLRNLAVDQALRERRIADAARTQYRQLEALGSLMDYVKPRSMLPSTRDWAASPDLLRLLCQSVERRQPETILELGSGVSTLIFAYCLERQGSGKLLSLEHEPEIADRTNRWLAHHKLEDFAEVIYTPLVPVRIADEEWHWYDLSKLEPPSRIDLLFVDGPPGNLRPLSRYPALPLLKPMLDETTTIVVDDAGRPDESRMVERWCRENPKLQAEYQDLEKGAFVLRWLRD